MPLSYEVSAHAVLEGGREEEGVVTLTLHFADGPVTTRTQIPSADPRLVKAAVLAERAGVAAMLEHWADQAMSPLKVETALKDGRWTADIHAALHVLHEDEHTTVVVTVDEPASFLDAQQKARAVVKDFAATIRPSEAERAEFMALPEEDRKRLGHAGYLLTGVGELTGERPPYLEDPHSPYST